MSPLSEKDLHYLNKLDGVYGASDVDLTKYSTMKLHSRGSILKINNLNSLVDVVLYLKKNKKTYRTIGWGANFILPEEPSFVLIKLDFEFNKEIINNNEKVFRLPGSAPLNILTSLAIKYGLKGWEVFTGVPASLGGAIAMNAGTSLGEIGVLIKEVEILDNCGKIRKIKINKNSFSYRKNNFLEEEDIIVYATMTYHGVEPDLGSRIKEYLSKRLESQPLKEKTCGCMYKNKELMVNDEEMSCRAGLSIDIIGLKGFSIGDLRISPKHANFMENRGRNSSSQVKTLVNETLELLEFHYGVTFETEVHIP